jgi:hypothetical protein
LERVAASHQFILHPPSEGLHPSTCAVATVADSCDVVALLRQHCAWQNTSAARLNQQVGTLQIDCVRASERASAVEQQWISMTARFQQGMALLQEALPRYGTRYTTGQQPTTQADQFN